MVSKPIWGWPFKWYGFMIPPLMSKTHHWKQTISGELINSWAFTKWSPQNFPSTFPLTVDRNCNYCYWHNNYREFVFPSKAQPWNSEIMSAKHLLMTSIMKIINFRRLLMTSIKKKKVHSRCTSVVHSLHWYSPKRN